MVIMLVMLGKYAGSNGVKVVEYKFLMHGILGAIL